MKRAREIIKADYAVERSNFLGTRLGLLGEIIEASRTLIASAEQGANDAVDALTRHQELNQPQESGPLPSATSVPRACGASLDAASA